MPFTGPFGLYELLTRFGGQQAQNLDHWWDKLGLTTPSQSAQFGNIGRPVYPQGGSSLADLIPLINYPEGRQWWRDAPGVENRTRADLNPWDKAADEEEIQRGRAYMLRQRPMFQYDKPKNPAPDYADWEW